MSRINNKIDKILDKISVDEDTFFVHKKEQQQYFAQSSDPILKRAGIGTLISGASVAFTTSIWRVLLSLLAGFIERSFERAIKSRVNQLNNTLSALFPSISSEQPKVALLTLHEKIGIVVA